MEGESLVSISEVVLLRSRTKSITLRLAVEDVVGAYCLINCKHLLAVFGEGNSIAC